MCARTGIKKWIVLTILFENQQYVTECKDQIYMNSGQSILFYYYLLALQITVNALNIVLWFILVYIG